MSLQKCIYWVDRNSVPPFRRATETKRAIDRLLFQILTRRLLRTFIWFRIALHLVVYIALGLLFNGCFIHVIFSLKRKVMICYLPSVKAFQSLRLLATASTSLLCLSLSGNSSSWTETAIDMCCSISVALQIAILPQQCKPYVCSYSFIGISMRPTWNFENFLQNDACSTPYYKRGSKIQHISPL